MYNELVKKISEAENPFTPMSAGEQEAISVPPKMCPKCKRPIKEVVVRQECFRRHTVDGEEMGAALGEDEWGDILAVEHYDRRHPCWANVEDIINV